MSQDLRIMESTRFQSFWKWAELPLYNISYCAQNKCSLNVCWKNEQLPPKHQGSTEGGAAMHSQSFWVIFILQEKMKQVLASWKGRKNLWEGGCHYPSWNGARLKLSSDLKKKKNVMEHLMTSHSALEPKLYVRHPCSPRACKSERFSYFKSSVFLNWHIF